MEIFLDFDVLGRWLFRFINSPTYLPPFWLAYFHFIGQICTKFIFCAPSYSEGETILCRRYFRILEFNHLLEAASEAGNACDFLDLPANRPKRSAPLMCSRLNSLLLCPFMVFPFQSKTRSSVIHSGCIACSSYMSAAIIWSIYAVPSWAFALLSA